MIDDFVLRTQRFALQWHETSSGTSDLTHTGANVKTRGSCINIAAEPPVIGHDLGQCHGVPITVVGFLAAGGRRPSVGVHHGERYRG